MQTWINPDTGVASDFLDSLKGISDNPEVVMLLILAVFAGSHSGLAYLRPYGELLYNGLVSHISLLYVLHHARS